MTLRIEENIPPHLVDVAKLLDKQIEVLGNGGDPKSVFDKDELLILKDMGHVNYLAKLKRIRANLGIQDLGE